jgi:hypothetical protein
MVLSLERSGLIRREPGRARSISVLVDPMALPPLQPSHLQTVKTLHEVIGRNIGWLSALALASLATCF